VDENEMELRERTTTRAKERIVGSRGMDCNLLLRVRTTNRTDAMPTQRRKNAKKIAFLISSCFLSLRVRHIRPGVVGGIFSLLPGWSCNHNLASAAKQT